MNSRYIALIALCALTLAVVPASAFTAQTLEVAIQDNGNADITFHYQLSWLEQIVYPVIPAKEQVVRSALESKFPSVILENIQVSDTSTVLTARGFSGVRTSAGAGTVTYSTPAISFMLAQDLLDTFPFAWAITPDFSPDVTIVQFPDGHKDVYTGASGIPAITYTVTK